MDIRCINRSAAVLGLAFYSTVGSANAQQPTIHEVGWRLEQAIVFENPMSAAFHPLEGAIYVLRRSTATDGLYRLDGAGAATLLATADQPLGILIDPLDGDVFVSEDAASGSIFRTPQRGTGRELWVSGFLPGDDDPMGMTIAPADYSGPLILPGQAIVVDFGWLHNPHGIWSWTPSQPQGELLLMGPQPALSYLADCTISSTAIFFVEHDSSGPRPGGIYELTASGSPVQIATSEPLADPVAVTVDPLHGDLLVKDATDRRVVRVSLPSGKVHDLFRNFGFADLSEWTGLEISADGRRVLVSDNGADRIWVFERVLAAH